MSLTRSLVATAVLLATVTAAQADNTTVAVTLPTTAFTDVTPFTGSAIDNKTFTGLADGVYNYKFTFSASDLSVFAASFDGVNLPITTAGPFSFGQLIGSFTVSTPAPLVFTLVGSASPGGAYTGILNVTAVPEPETYAMFLAGLGALGLMASRRRQQG